MKKLFFYCILLSVGFAGCKKEDTLKNDKGQVVVQGNYTLRIQAKHHWWAVSYLPVYLKMNATSWPGTDSTKYELMTMTDVDGNCQFNHLFSGNYYVYAHGFDLIYGMNVTGYGPIQLNTTTAPNREFDFLLNVSE